MRHDGGDPDWGRRAADFKVRGRAAGFIPTEFAKRAEFLDSESCGRVGDQGATRGAGKLPCVVTNRARVLRPTALTVNPDLVFEPGLAVGDIKFKTDFEEMPRPDLYQVVTFASARGMSQAALVSFKTTALPPLPDIPFGDIVVQHLCWDANARQISGRCRRRPREERSALARFRTRCSARVCCDWAVTFKLRHVPTGPIDLAVWRHFAAR